MLLIIQDSTFKPIYYHILFKLSDNRGVLVNLARSRTWCFVSLRAIMRVKATLKASAFLFATPRCLRIAGSSLLLCFNHFSNFSVFPLSSSKCSQHDDSDNEDLSESETVKDKRNKEKGKKVKRKKDKKDKKHKKGEKDKKRKTSAKRAQSRLRNAASSSQAAVCALCAARVDQCVQRAAHSAMPAQLQPTCLHRVSRFNVRID